MRRCAVFVVLVAFLFSCGGQWAVLQCVAWGNMIREYSQVVPLGEAVHMTFSGQYPCALCKAIAEKKKSDHDSRVALLKMDKPIVAPAFSLRPRQVTGAATFYGSRASFLRSRAEVPPTPPPRFA
jgi:hypothetical protein